MKSYGSGGKVEVNNVTVKSKCIEELISPENPVISCWSGPSPSSYSNSVNLVQNGDKVLLP